MQIGWLSRYPAALPDAASSSGYTLLHFGPRNINSGIGFAGLDDFIFKIVVAGDAP
jgi:hypothetical protein